MEGRLDTTLEELKRMMNGMTIQHNEMRTQMNNKDREQNSYGGSILGNLGMVNGGEVQGAMVGVQGNKLGPKLEFPRFGEKGVDDWLFKVEQFFSLDKIHESTKISVISLHLDGCALHWHKNFIKIKRRVPEWNEYKEAIKS